MGIYADSIGLYRPQIFIVFWVPETIQIIVFGP